jgi:ankyrin repeat protein
VDGKVPLSVAAEDGHIDIVKLLIELGETPNTRTRMDSRRSIRALRAKKENSY